jgi:hypothetical protein
MRVWLQKQKKKEEAKAASQAPPTPAESTPAAPEVQPVGDAADKPVESIEETPKAEGAAGEQASLESGCDADKRVGSASVQPNEVGLCLSVLLPPSRTDELRKQDRTYGVSSLCLARMNMIVAARASDPECTSSFPASSLMPTRIPRLKTATPNDAAVLRLKMPPRPQNLLPQMLQRTSRTMQTPRTVP